MMATVPHVTSGLELRKFQADGFLLTRVYQGVASVRHKEMKRIYYQFVLVISFKMSDT